MAKKDPEKTARNRIIDELTQELRKLLPTVLATTGIENEHSLHGKIGGKFANYIDIENDVIHSAEHFICLWYEGYEIYLSKKAGPSSRHRQTYALIRQHPVLKEYLFSFLKRTYLRQYEALSKKRPKIEDSEIYIGQNNADYGILITPRFKNGNWENDKSEIRHFD